MTRSRKTLTSVAAPRLRDGRYGICRIWLCPAELPSDIEGLKSQQRRWAMGGIQNARKFLRPILAGKDLSAGFKAEAAFHMLGNLSSPLFLAVILSAAAVNILGGSVPAAFYWFIGNIGFAASGGILRLLSARRP